MTIPDERLNDLEESAWQGLSWIHVRDLREIVAEIREARSYREMVDKARTLLDDDFWLAETSGYADYINQLREAVGLPETSEREVEE